MAYSSMSKRAKVEYLPDDYTSASGFIHNVSPMKIAKNGASFFNAEIQEDKGFTGIVGYSVENQKKLAEMEKQRSPIKLSNVLKVASYRKLGTFDLRIHGKSLITEPKKKLNFTFNPPKTIDIQTLTIAEVKLTPEKTRVSVNAKVVAFVDTEEQKLKYKEKPLTRTTYTVADDTGSMPCTFWGSDVEKIKLNSSYNLSNVTVRMYGTKKITTNPESKITPIQDLQDVQFETEELPVKQIEITGANVSTYLTCQFCQQRLIINEELPTVKCTSCQKRQLVKSLIEVKKCDIDTHNHTYHIPINVLQKVLPAGDMSDDDIELYFLANEHFQITTVSPDSSVVAKIEKK